jgi:hypothetical protein
MNINAILKKDQEQWWNRLLWGKKSLRERLNDPVFESSSNEDILSFYNLGLMQATLLAEVIRNQDKQEFVNPEFISFLKLKNKEIDKYKDLLKSIRLLTIALQLKDIFFTLWNIENRFQGFQEQNFYDFIAELIEKNVTQSEFLTILNQRFDEDISFLDNSNIQTALKSYKKGIEILSVNNLGLKLLGNFQKNQINYMIFLKNFNDMINILIEKKYIHHLSSLEIYVNRNRNSVFFKQISKVIELSGTLNNYKNQALVIQYVGLNYKYTSDYLEFKEFLNFLSQWEKTYQIITNIRQEYKEMSQKLPQEFKQEIPGLEIYQKYHNLLC